MKPDDQIYEDSRERGYGMVYVVLLGVILMVVAWTCLVSWVVNLIWG